MTSQCETTYWIALAHLPRWGAEKINRLVVKIIHEKQMGLADFFEAQETWQTDFELSEAQVQDLIQAKTELPNTAFLAEDLLSQGFELVPISSPEYSPTLKNNLKVKAPTVLYVKGNKQIMQENSIAIVGSRNADEVSLQFTDNIAKKASEQYQVVVSGFARGVDKQALDSALKYRGQSIIVLPQGIMTFGSGIKKYYQAITAGDALVLSIFPPKAVWATGLAMARNPIIYALASEIYVAQSADSGGTWTGALDGLKKNRCVCVRQPQEGEQNANQLLIDKGAKAVDFEGYPIVSNPTDKQAPANNETAEDTAQQIAILLQNQALTPKQIREKINTKLSEKALIQHIKALPNVKKIKKSNKIHYFISAEIPGLF
jgi:predicted Rossmann fold nucleotide-binding protein DprA/Smf involved in DNA uptake